jgi:hypothetical protein
MAHQSLFSALPKAGNNMELNLVNTCSLLFFLPMVLWALNVLLRGKQRLPDVEFLRVCEKPGKAGDTDDVQAFLNDSMSAIMKGYKQVKSLSISHRLDL